MRVSKSPERIWEEYQRGVQYKTGLGLYENVERNNNFFNDRQWEGVKAPDLDKPVFNILKPVVNYYTAMLISDDIAVNVELMGAERPPAVRDAGSAAPTERELSQPEVGAAAVKWAPGGGAERPPAVRDAGNAAKGTGGLRLPGPRQAGGLSPLSLAPQIVAQEVDHILERANVRFKNRRMIRNCAVDGDACFYVWFDPDAETGFDYKGDIKVDILDNTNVYFGNPAEPDEQEQPYVILSYRRLTEDVRAEAVANGLPADEITPDGERLYMNEGRDTERDYTTVLLKLWKENGTVRMVRCTEKALVRAEADTGYKRYPIAWMNWEAVKNSYHGVSPLTGKINNQIFINKIYALSMRFVANNAFPKVVYDRTRLPQGWSNDVNKAIGVAGDPNTAIFSGYKAPDMSGDAMNMAKETMRSTKELMGASDAALGNVKPDNTSAIIAVQKAAGMPLDIQRMDFHNFVENYVRIFIEIMRVNYGTRWVSVATEDGGRLAGEWDFSLLDRCAMRLKVEIGAGSYWSELMQVQTLDNLMAKKILPDALSYLEAVPEGYIKDKQKIIDRIRAAGGGPGAMPPSAGSAGPAGPLRPAVGGNGLAGQAPGGMPLSVGSAGSAGPLRPAVGGNGAAGQAPGGLPPSVGLAGQAPGGGGPAAMPPSVGSAGSAGPLRPAVGGNGAAGQAPGLGPDGRLTVDGFSVVLQELMGMPAAEAARTLERLPFAKEDKAMLRAALDEWDARGERKKAGRGARGSAGGSARGAGAASKEDANGGRGPAWRGARGEDGAPAGGAEELSLTPGEAEEIAVALADVLPAEAKRAVLGMNIPQAQKRGLLKLVERKRAGRR